MESIRSSALFSTVPIVPSVPVVKVTGLDVGTLGDARLLAYRTCLLERQLLDFTSTITPVISTSGGCSHLRLVHVFFTLVVDIFQVIANFYSFSRCLP